MKALNKFYLIKVEKYKGSLKVNRVNLSKNLNSAQCTHIWAIPRQMV